MKNCRAVGTRQCTKGLIAHFCKWFHVDWWTFCFECFAFKEPTLNWGSDTWGAKMWSTRFIHTLMWKTRRLMRGEGKKKSCFDCMCENSRWATEQTAHVTTVAAPWLTREKRQGATGQPDNTKKTTTNKPKKNNRNREEEIQEEAKLTVSLSANYCTVDDFPSKLWRSWLDCIRC